ncbi:LysM peptidoglycan-binding domain-containing protein [Salipiger profundus]|jgi:nucleoid-associated protein YgaU|uniref:LysM peptidoglycan-binding domain-containing protein n=2 Tax=Salipiger TaxID=263377 RepID=UPI0008F2E16C|nr:LysM peptidoglycan-binding domain-containing protein [Salipiger profundus]SFC20803.1 Nucleoid-associated protein YgaU, contains BON and LysM domains [Salipiger profundus]
MTSRALGWVLLCAAVLVALLYLGDAIGPGLKPLSLVRPQPEANEAPAVTSPEQAPEAAPAVASSTGEPAPVTTDADPAGRQAAPSETAKAQADHAMASNADAPSAGLSLSRVAPDAPVATRTPDAPETRDVPETADADRPEAPAAAPDAPSFDLVRADPSGQTLVAGSAPPGAQVSVLLDGVPQPDVAPQPVDRSGRFALFLDLPPAAEPRVLRLRMTRDGQEVDSVDEVILAPPPTTPASAGATAAAARSELAALSRGAGAPASPATPQLAGEEPAAAPFEGAATAQDSAAPETVPAPPPPAQTVLLSNAEGVEVLQAPAPRAPNEVVIDAIAYDDAGNVVLSGRGSAAASLRIYLDNRSVATSQVPGTGRWRAALPDIETGTYTLRVDQLDAGGAVTARAESPFLREEPARLAAAGEGGAPLGAVTVQPGHTLWALARDRYGEGMAYVKVFEANRDQIRDPDLIYPGQVFDLPD